VEKRPQGKTRVEKKQKTARSGDSYPQCPGEEITKKKEASGKGEKGEGKRVFPAPWFPKVFMNPKSNPEEGMKSELPMSNRRQGGQMSEYGGGWKI